MAVGRSLVRSLKLAWYFAAASVELLLHRPRSRREGAEWLNRFCSRVIRGFGVRYTIDGEFPTRGALISEHTGYVDIILFAAMKPVVFFSKAELEHTPVLGFMASAAGTVFVERNAGGSALKARSGMQAAAHDEIPVVFFPEGTTTNGTHLLPFRSGLLAEALGAEEPITAAHIWYTLDEDNGPEASVQDDVCYWGDDANLLTHIWKFVGLNGVHAHVRIAEKPIEFSAEALADRKMAAVEAREAVLALAPAGYYTRPDGLTDDAAVLQETAAK